MQKHRPQWHMKLVARYSFSGSIPSKFEYKQRRHKQTFGKITTIFICIFIFICISYDQGLPSCDNNEMTPLPIILAAIFLTRNCSYKIVHGTAFSSNNRLDVRELKTESVRALSRYFGMTLLWL